MTLNVEVENEDNVLSKVHGFERSLDSEVDSPWYSAVVSSYGETPSELMDFDGVIRPETVTGYHEDFPQQYDWRHYDNVEIPFEISIIEPEITLPVVESDLQEAQEVLTERGYDTGFYLEDTAPEGPFENPEHALASIAGIEILMEVQDSENEVVFDYSGNFAPSDQTTLTADEEEAELMRQVSNALGNR